MVPAAPLLPTTAAVSAAVAHRAGPAATVVVGPVEVLPDVVWAEEGRVVVDEPAEDADPPGGVDDEFEEQATRRPPPPRMTATTVTTVLVRRSVLVLLIDRLPTGPWNAGSRPSRSVRSGPLPVSLGRTRRVVSLTPFAGPGL